MGITHIKPYTDQEFYTLQRDLTRIRFKGLPRELKSATTPFFLLWQPILNKKRTKVLKKPIGGKAWQTKKNLKSYEQLLTEYTDRRMNAPVGIGFAYNEDHPFICIDVDQMTETNQEMIKTLESYTEQSPSGNGQHVIVRVTDKKQFQQIFGNAKHLNNMYRDLYVSTGYVTMTGQSINGHEVKEFDTKELQSILGPYYLAPKEQTPELELEKLVKKARLEEYKESPAVLSSVQIKKYLDALPVQCLTDDTFTRLQQNKIADIDPKCTEEARTPWLIVGQALHNNFSNPMASLLDGFILWQQWSQLGNKYDEKDLIDCWESFSNTNTENPITIKAVIKLFNAQKPLFPDLGARGGKLGTFANFQVYMKFYKYELKFNEISKNLTFNIPKERKEYWKLSKIDSGTVDQKAELIKSDLLSIGFPASAYNKNQLVAFIQSLSQENSYNPIRDYFTECGTEWDEKDRIRDLFATLELTYREQLAGYQIETIYMFLHRWLIQVVAAACRGDKKFDKVLKQFSRVLIFVGSQGIGKTRWIQSLFPETLQKYCLGSKAMKLTGFRSDHVKAVMEITNTLICNINEIDQQFTERNYSDFKEFLDTDEDILVLPYGREPVRQIRRTVFIGSSNLPHFLTDPTGNRRIELIHCRELQVNHGINIDQLWGQVYTLYKNGERWWFDDREPEDELFIRERTRLNSTAMRVRDSSFIGHLEEIYDPQQPHDTWRKMTFVQIRTQVGQYAAQDRNGGVRNQFRAQKGDLENWLKTFRNPISETSGKPGSRVWYYIPPIRGEMAGAGFFEPSDQELKQKEKQMRAQNKYLTRKKSEEVEHV